MNNDFQKRLAAVFSKIASDGKVMDYEDLFLLESRAEELGFFFCSMNEARAGEHVLVAYTRRCMDRALNSTPHTH